MFANKAYAAMNKTGNKISVEGANALSEVLKVNTTLTALSLRSKHQHEKRCQARTQHQQEITQQTPGSVLKEYEH